MYFNTDSNTAAVIESTQQSSPYGENQRRQSVDPPAPVTKDFNVWKDGKPTLWSQTKQDVYCY